MAHASPRIEVLADRDALSRAAAERFCELAREATGRHGMFTVALSGGSTPRDFYALLANPDAAYRAQLQWERIHFFFGDERHVPPDHAESNFRMANEAMLSRVPVPGGNVHRIPAEVADADTAAHAYEDELRRFFRPGKDQPPHFDLALMGLGPDGHTASLFPQTAALHERHRWVVGNWVERLHTDRITLTAPALCNAVHVLFLVAGADKAVALRDVLHGPFHPDQWPAQIFRNCPAQVTWLIDQLAARQLPKRA
ncbi:MAG TPA: 6-phosphogluconolactonase [Pirellulales bacterium]|jgi:6-phosphogluconolactonase|nr:6-phosphogluconolactonase [Pirellulales bacterium]